MNDKEVWQFKVEDDFIRKPIFDGEVEIPGDRGKTIPEVVESFLREVPNALAEMHILYVGRRNA